MKNNQLPMEWATQPLSKFIKKIESGSRPKGGAQQEGTPSIGGEHINWNGTLNTTNMKYIPNDYYDNLKKGKIAGKDVLLVKDGATIGKLLLRGLT